MSESQIDEAEASREELLNWLDDADTWRPGSGGPKASREHGETLNAAYRYIPMSVLKEWFSRSKIQHHLDAVFARSDKAAPDAETILKYYLRPFLILVSIGRGRKILHFVKHDHLKDECLPFQTLPHGLSASNDWFTKFCETQWQFYPVQFTYNMDRDLSSKHILPLRYVSKLGGGGSAVTYEVQIDTEYNGLRPSEHGESNALERNRDTYVIKSFQTDEAQECYETECDGFRNLRCDSKPPANIIAFYGNFMWGTSRNILLEYADRGTLKDYMKNEEPPSRREDIEQFWYNVLALFDGLTTIHGKAKMPSSKHKFMIGWHQDLSPSNILVLSGKSGNPYDCQFKIADLEHSHFQRSMDVRDATAKDSKGTFAYGPPESCRTDPDVQGWDLRVDQSVDVWAMSCILSEVAVWVAFGLRKVDQYQQDRGAEFKRKTGKEGQCFHNEVEDILDAVREIHGEVKSNHRVMDKLTPQVIESIERDMMLVNPRSRKHAKQLYHSSKRIIDKPLSAGVRSPLVGHSSSNSVSAMPPNLKIPTLHPNGQPSPPLYPQFSALEVQEVHTGKLLGDKPNGDKHCYKNSFEVENSLDPDNQRRHGNDETSVSRRSPRTSPSFEAKQRLSHAESEVPERGFESSPVSGYTGAPPQDLKPVPGRKHAPLPLAKALDLKRQKEQGDSPSGSIAHTQLVSSLKGRDHVFVVDLAASMTDHRLLMKDWLEILGYMVQNADPDDMDVYFTGSSRRRKAKSWKKLVSMFDRQSFEDTTRRPAIHHLFDIRHLIIQILEDYQNHLCETHYIKHYLGFGGMPKKGPRKMSMYVLTNGDWGRQKDLETQISALVTELLQNGKTNKQVAIQFLRFGDVPQGKRNLEKLDFGLELKLDLIDTEPANGGDAYKAMFGPVDEDWDGDPSR